MLFKPDYERHCTRLRPGQHTGLQDILFVDGLTTTVDFHIDMQLKLEWPASRKYLHTFDFTNPATLATILEQNSFKLIVFCNLVGDFERYYAESPSRGRWLYAQQKENLERVERAMKASVTEKGATMVLFCCEAVEWVHNGMFGKTWEKEHYIRTSCYRAAAASCMVPEAPSSVNANAILLGKVPWEEHWYATTGSPQKGPLISQVYPRLGPGLCSVAAGAAGAGRILYMGDVNAEKGTCQVLQQLAAEIIKHAPQPQSYRIAAGHQAAQNLKRPADALSPQPDKRLRVYAGEPRVNQSPQLPPLPAVSPPKPGIDAVAVYRAALIKKLQEKRYMTFAQLGNDLRRPAAVLGLKWFMQQDRAFKVGRDVAWLS